MKHPNCLFSALLLFFPFLAFSQRQMTVRALDITRQTALHDFTLMVVHEQDTAVMIIAAENPSLTLSAGNYELIIQKEGYQIASTDKWDCPEDTATIIVEFRLLKKDATPREVRRGNRNSRKMGTDDSLNPVSTGGFKKDRAGIGRHFTSIVYVITKGSLATHWIAE